MDDKKTNNRQEDMESIIGRIHADGSSPADQIERPHTGVSSVDEALWRLKTLQLVRDTKEKAERLSRFHQDAFSNPAAKTGWNQENLINATEYPITRLTQNWQLLTSLYRSSWIVQRVCNAIPEDAITDLKIEAPGLDDEEVSRLNEEIRTTHLRESLLEGLRWGRLYGGAAAIIMISNQEEDLSQPIDVNNILPGSFRGLYIVDRWSGIYPSLDLVKDERDPDFGLPDYYEVRDENGIGQYRVHHSRVLRFCGAKMPFWEQVAEQYWGTSAIEPMYDELIKHDNVAYNIANLTFKANLNVLRVENLDQMFATSSTVHQRRMFQMLSAINTIENSLGIRLINSTDDLQQFQYSFTGLPEVMDIAMMDMAGATGIPATRLFGRSPAGMNATGESDEKMYRQTLENERAIHIMPALERIIPIICRSSIGRFPKGVKFKLPSLIELTEMDKLSIIDQHSGAMERLFQSNLVPGDVVLECMRNAQLSHDIVSPIRDEDIEKVKGKFMNDLQQQADPYGGAAQSAGEAYGQEGYGQEGEEGQEGQEGEEQEVEGQPQEGQEQPSEEAPEEEEAEEQPEEEPEEEQPEDDDVQEEDQEEEEENVDEERAESDNEDDDVQEDESAEYEEMENSRNARGDSAIRLLRKKRFDSIVKAVEKALFGATRRSINNQSQNAHDDDGVDSLKELAQNTEADFLKEKESKVSAFKSAVGKKIMNALSPHDADKEEKYNAWRKRELLRKNAEDARRSKQEAQKVQKNKPVNQTKPKQSTRGTGMAKPKH